MSDVIRGACLCGQVRFELREPQTMGVCYCTRCQRAVGSAAWPVVVVAQDGFELTKGTDAMKQYHEEGFSDRYFCGHCGSSIYSDAGESYYVSAGLLDDLPLTPEWHIQVANKPHWHEIGDDAPQFLEYPAQQ